jgi:hypothetical protein
MEDTIQADPNKIFGTIRITHVSYVVASGYVKRERERVRERLMSSP